MITAVPKRFVAPVVMGLGLAMIATAAPALAKSGARVGGASNAVVAFVDTGINPYHKVFRDNSPRAFKHPSTYIPGFPKDAQALRLTFDADDYWDAVKADCKRVWSKIKPGRLYWFPGTKIVGGITFEPAGPLNCDDSEPQAGGRILDPDGHGTMVASRATGAGYGACPDCRVVSVQFPTSIPILNPSESTDHAVKAIRWAANNSSWIDAQSNSWGPVVPLWEPTGEAGLLTANPELVRAVEEVSRRHLAFWASGNGALFRFGVLGHPTLLAPHMGPSAVIVGGHDSGYVNTWPGFPPHVVSDSCASWAADHEELKKSRDSEGGGTSGATPFAAGGAGGIVLEARRILRDSGTGVVKGVVASGRSGHVSKGPLKDGKFTIKEWRDVLFKTATDRPARRHEDGPPCEVEPYRGAPYAPTPVKWTDVPEGYPEYVHIGYGAVDDPAMSVAAKVLRGQKKLPDRSDTDAFFENDRRARTLLHELFSQGPDLGAGAAAGR